jgi:hypothetical protein
VLIARVSRRDELAHERLEKSLVRHLESSPFDKGSKVLLTRTELP